MTKTDLTSADLAGLSGAGELMEREWAPCRYDCPVHADVRAYVELIAQGRWQEAVDVIRDALPFAAVCGRICHHPCESNCRRNDIDAAVAVREVKRFVAEVQGARGASVRKPARQDKAKVAVIGAGPAGMSAALDLARMGYRPTVFEKFPVGGGIPATAIPKYRLPRDVIQMDIDWICAHGVELRTGVEVGKDKTIADLLDKEGFAAVLVAAGLSKSRLLPLPGSDHPRVLGVMDFLTALAFDKSVDLGQDVLVIGGGNVAMDAARSAVRLGARRVRAMCLEDEQEMPAWKWEQDEAKEEGVTFTHRRGPVEVIVADGKITGLKARKVTRVFDENRRFNPQYDDSDTVTFECDTVILAIGQMADTGFVAGSDLKLDPRGQLEYNPATHQTSRPNVFACGEIVTAPGSAVEACANGQRAARVIDAFLSGREIRIDDTLPPQIGRIDPGSPCFQNVKRTQRIGVAVEPPEKRSSDFAPVDHTLTAEQAVREARRCMICGSGAEVLVDKCAACLTCLRVCPFGVPKVTDVARIHSDLCQACGMCVADCPANAIVPKGWAPGALVERTKKELAALDGRKVVAYVCGHYAPATAWSSQPEDAVPGVAEIYLPSMCRLSTAEMLHAFEAGARGVIVVAAEVGADRYPGATERIRKRVQQGKDLLKEIGLDGERLVLLEEASRGRSAMREAIAAAADKIAPLPRTNHQVHEDHQERI